MHNLLARKVVLGLVALFSMIIIGCTDKPPSHDAADTKKTEKALAEGSREVGVSNIVNWTQKKTLKYIYELCDREKLICYAYTQNQMTGKFIFLYKCAGYGIPFSAQYTSPEKIVDAPNHLGFSTGGYHFMTVPQSEPNGIYMPSSSTATWVIAIDPETNEPEVHYAEPLLYVTPKPLRTSIVMNPEDYAIYDKKKPGKDDEKKTEKSD